MSNSGDFVTDPLGRVAIINEANRGRRGKSFALSAIAAALGINLHDATGGTGRGFMPTHWPGFGGPRTRYTLDKELAKQNRGMPHRGARECERRRIGGFHRARRRY